MPPRMCTVPANRGRTPAMSFFFELTGPAQPYKGTERVMETTTRSFLLRAADAFSADGYGRVIRSIRNELTEALGEDSLYTADPGGKIKRIYTTREDFENACDQVAAFIDKHTVSG